MMGMIKIDINVSEIRARKKTIMTKGFYDRINSNENHLESVEVALDVHHGHFGRFRVLLEAVQAAAQLVRGVPQPRRPKLAHPDRVLLAAMLHVQEMHQSVPQRVATRARALVLKEVVLPRERVQQTGCHFPDYVAEHPDLVFRR